MSSHCEDLIIKTVRINEFAQGNTGRKPRTKRKRMAKFW